MQISNPFVLLRESFYVFYNINLGYYTIKGNISYIYLSQIKNKNTKIILYSSWKTKCSRVTKMRVTS